MLFESNKLTNKKGENALIFIDFGKMYYNCSIVDLLGKLEDQKLTGFPFQENRETNKKEKQSPVTEGSKIRILSSNTITDEKLIKYLECRHPFILKKNKQVINKTSFHFIA